LGIIVDAASRLGFSNIVGASPTIVAVTEKRVTEAKKRVSVSEIRFWITPTAVWTMKN
jgi:hypothetical protein